MEIFRQILVCIFVKFILYLTIAINLCGIDALIITCSDIMFMHHSPDGFSNRYLFQDSLLPDPHKAVPREDYVIVHAPNKATA